MFTFYLSFTKQKHPNIYKQNPANYWEFGSDSIAVAVLRGTFALAPAGRTVPTTGTPQPGSAKEKIHRKSGKGQKKKEKNQKENFHDNRESEGKD